MQVSIVNFSEVRKNKSIRIDGDFWVKMPYKSPTLLYKRIGDYLKKSQYGLSISMNEDGDGYPIYRMNEIQNMLCNLHVSKFANISETDKVNFVLKNKDVLFNRTNSYEWVGRTGIYYKNDIDHIFASYLVRFVPNSEVILPEYLTTFLNTKYGVQDIKRRSRPSINQTNVNPEELKEIEIPLLSTKIQKYIELFFYKSSRARLIGHEVYQQAQDILLDELGLNDWQPKHELCFIKHYSDTVEAERMDAEYFQPKYDDIINAIKSYKGGWDTLGNLFELKNTNYTPNNKEKYHYIELANINSNGEIIDCTIDRGENLPSRARRQAKEGDIIVSSIEGSLSSIALIDNNYDNALCSTGFHVVTSRAINPQTILVLLKSIVGELQLKKGCSGTILTAINQDAFNDIIIPIISEVKQQEIQQKVQESIKLRKQSNQLLENAKIAVEMAIEQDEETAMDWLEAQSV